LEPFAGGEQARGVHLVFQTRDDQAPVGGPVKHMEVKDRSMARNFLGAAGPGQRWEWAGSGAMNRQAVDFHPGADSFETLDAGLGNQAFAGGADVEKVIAAFAGDVNKIVDDGFG